MLFFEVLAALLLGVTAGIFTGLVPGIHINLVSLLLVSFSGYFLGFTSPLSLGVFIIAMGVTHTFLDAIPSIFLGAPDAEKALAVLPGHRLLMEGKGFEAVKLTVIGAFFGLLITVLLAPLMIPFVPFIYNLIQPYIGYLLIVVVLFMTLREKGIKKLWSLFIFLLSGILGLIVFSWPNLKQPLFPMLSGLFGISSLIISLSENVNIPKQIISEGIHVKLKERIKAISTSFFSGSLTGLLPGLGAAEAAVIGMEIVPNISNYGFMILIGGIGTVNFLFGLVAFYTLDKARNGAIVALMQIVESISLNELVIYLFVAVIAGSISVFLALKITKVFANTIGKMNYNLLSIAVMAFISILVFLISGFAGFSILLVSTAIGLIAPLVGFKRSTAMGCLLLPVILYFVL